MLVVDQSGAVQNGSGVKLISSMAERPLELWYSSDSTGRLYARVKGEITQTSPLTTVSEIRLAVSITGYEIPSTILSAAFRDSISAKSPDVFRGGH